MSNYCTDTYLVRYKSKNTIQGIITKKEYFSDWVNVILITNRESLPKAVANLVPDNIVQRKNPKEAAQRSVDKTFTKLGRGIEIELCSVEYSWPEHVYNIHPIERQVK